MVAQERSDGFVVGSVAPHRHREIDNTLFKSISGQSQPNQMIADLILHELTHIYFKHGTVSLPKTVLYYGEAIFLFRYHDHSMERVPFRTSDEFWAFSKARFGTVYRFVTPPPEAGGGRQNKIRRPTKRTS
jgi:hypothetical protein